MANKGIQVLPVYYKRQYIEWQDRGESKGAPVNIYDAGDSTYLQTTRDKGNKDRLANGNYLENTVSHFVVLLGKNSYNSFDFYESDSIKN